MIKNHWGKNTLKKYTGLKKDWLDPDGHERKGRSDQVPAGDKRQHGQLVSHPHGKLQISRQRTTRSFSIERWSRSPLSGISIFHRNRTLTVPYSQDR
jgi:hypothetical protein